MTPANPNINHGWRNAARGCLLGLLAAQQLLAIRPAPPLGLGAKILGAGKPVTVKIVPGEALYTSDIIVQRCFPIDCLYYMLGTNRDSSDISLGTIPEGEEIDLRILVRETLYEFRSGPASRNLDGIAHAIVAQDGAILKVGFEDAYGGDDRDFNDVTVEITGAKISVPFSGLPVSPSNGTNLSLDQNGGLQILPILAGDPSGVSTPLGDADGWQGTISFDGEAPNAQLTYSAQSEPGLPDLVGRHTAAADGMTDLELSFPRALQRSSLQLDAFLNGQKVASTQVQPTADHALTFAPARYLEAKAKKIKKIKIKKIKAGPVTIEGIEIVFGLTSGEIDEVGDLDFDTLALTLSDPGLPASGFSELALSAANVSSLTLESQSVSKFDQFHRSLDGATLEPQGGTLTVNRDPAGGENLGVAIDLADVDSFNLTWSRFIPLGLTVTGSSLELGAQGKMNGVPEQGLGTLRVTQLTMADTSAEVTADFSALGSQTQRILIYDGETLIADETGHTGAAARALAWPTGAGIGQASFGPLQGYALQFPENTWIQILGDPWMVGDKLIVLAENPTASVGPVSQLSLRATRLPFISLIDEAVFPLPPPKATPNLRISAAWGSSGVGSSPFGPRLTAYIAVKNTSGVDCYPPTDASFVIGAYYKSLGLVTATSVGTFPSVIKAGETRYFIAQSLDDPHQSVIYGGFVDFYVSSQAPGQPDLSAATRPACEGEVFLADNNAHSAKKVVMNP